MIEFSSPPLSFTMQKYMELVVLLESCSSCAGFCVSLGQRFFSDGIKEIDKVIIPRLLSTVGSSVLSRVIPSYAILYWFCTMVGL